MKRLLYKVLFVSVFTFSSFTTQFFFSSPLALAQQACVCHVSSGPGSCGVGNTIGCTLCPNPNAFPAHIGHGDAAFNCQCGDGVCDSNDNEDCFSCPQDCDSGGQQCATCGDGIVDDFEECGEPGLNACAANEICDNCRCFEPLPECAVDVDCDDGNACTDDACDQQDFTCSNTPNTQNICDDNNLCTENDRCETGGTCTGDAVICLAPGECYNDGICDPLDGSCVDQPKQAGAACGDNNFCNGLESCDGTGICEPGTSPVLCDDGNVCTQDACNLQDGSCFFSPLLGTSCDDMNACTQGDLCDAGGVCQAGTVIDCDDSNVCTDDACDSGSGCTNIPNSVTQSCYTGPVGTEGVGTCQAGVFQCFDGILGTTCENEVLPQADDNCNGIDDDCDGEIDETGGCAGIEDARVEGEEAGGTEAEGAGVEGEEVEGGIAGIQNPFGCLQGSGNLGSSDFSKADCKGWTCSVQKGSLSDQTRSGFELLFFGFVLLLGGLRIIRRRLAE